MQPYLCCQPHQRQVFLLLSLQSLMVVELDNQTKQKWSNSLPGDCSVTPSGDRGGGLVESTVRKGGWGVGDGGWGCGSDGGGWGL